MLQLDHKLWALLAAELNQQIIHLKLLSCFSTSKTDVIFGFSGLHAPEYWIHWQINAQLALITKPEANLVNARNKLPAFTELIDKEIIGVFSHPNERSFHIEFSEDWKLVFKMHGRNANLLLLQANAVARLFRKELLSDQEFQMPTIKEATAEHQELRNYIVEIQQLGNLAPVQRSDDTLLDTITRSARLYLKKWHFDHERERLARMARQEIKSTHSHLTKLEHRLNELVLLPDEKHLADLLLTNLHLIKEQSALVELNDWKTNENIRIKLNPELSAQENITRYYRRAKNRVKEWNHIEEQIEVYQQKLASIEEYLQDVLSCTDFKTLKPLKQTKEAEQKSKQERKPYKEFELMGYQIWLGKSAKDNDELTLKHAKKDDLWLHARDVSGSHVIIKRKSNQWPPIEVREFAAKLAAKNSKRQHDTLCPVTCTEKKWVRKKKGMMPGEVLVEKEQEVLLVSPED